jgi:hypothetical protein
MNSLAVAVMARTKVLLENSKWMCCEPPSRVRVRRSSIGARVDGGSRWITDLAVQGE